MVSYKLSCFFFLQHFTRHSTIGYRSRVSYRRSNHYNIIYLYTAGGHTNTHSLAVMEWKKNQLSASARIIGPAPLSFASRLRRPLRLFFPSPPHYDPFVYPPSPRVPISVLRARACTHTLYISWGDYFLKKHSIHHRGGFTRDERRRRCSSPFRD